MGLTSPCAGATPLGGRRARARAVARDTRDRYDTGYDTHPPVGVTNEEMAVRDRIRRVLGHVATLVVKNETAEGVLPDDDAKLVAAGEAEALAAPNRGPLLVDGKLNPLIAPLFEEWGFFVLEGVVGEEELDDLRRDIGDLIDRAPVRSGAELDKFGRPAEDAQWNIQPPLSDPNGGKGRSPAKGMRTPTPADGAPEEVVMSLQSYLPHSEAGLRLYGHPGLLELAAAVNGESFCPFSESIQIKLPGLGPSVTWHQDGTTHWDKPEPEHGFNFMCQVCYCSFFDTDYLYASRFGVHAITTSFCCVAALWLNRREWCLGRSEVSPHRAD